MRHWKEILTLFRNDLKGYIFDWSLADWSHHRLLWGNSSYSCCVVLPMFKERKYDDDLKVLEATVKIYAIIKKICCLAVNLRYPTAYPHLLLFVFGNIPNC